MITQISGTGIGEADFCMSLQPVNVIYGPSFAGKTTRINAIRLGLLGYVPKIGKTHEDIMTLARGSAICVSVRNAQSSFTRGWARVGRGIKASLDGEVPAFPPVLLDPSEYFALGGKDRIRYVFSHCLIDGEFSGAEISATVKELKFENTPETEAVIGRVAAAIADSDYERHDRGEPIQEWLETLIADYREQSKLAGQNVKRMESTGQGITLTSGETRALRDQSSALAEHRKLLIDLRSAAQTLQGEIVRASGNAKVREEIESKLALPKNQNLETRIEVAQKEVGRLAQSTAGYKSAVADALAAALAAESRVATVHDNLAQVQTTQADAAGLIAEIMAQECCPTCKTKKKGWQSVVVNDYETRKIKYEVDLDKWRAALTERQGVLRAMQAALVTAKELDREHQDKLTAFATAEATLYVLTNALIMRDSLLAILAHNPLVDDNEARSKLGSISVDAQTAQAEVARLEAAQREYQRAMDGEAQAARVVAELTKAQAEYAVLKAVVKLLEEKQSGMVDEVFARLLATANKLAGSILKSPLAYQDGEVGRWADKGVWVPIRAFSGTEEAVAFAALALALVAQAEFRLVIIDELGRMDVGIRAMLVNRIAELVEAGDIHQAILLDTTATWVPTGINTIKVG